MNPEATHNIAPVDPFSIQLSYRWVVLLLSRNARRSFPAEIRNETRGLRGDICVYRSILPFTGFLRLRLTTRLIPGGYLRRSTREFPLRNVLRRVEERHAHHFGIHDAVSGELYLDTRAPLPSGAGHDRQGDI